MKIKRLVLTVTALVSALVLQAGVANAVSDYSSTSQNKPSPHPERTSPAPKKAGPSQQQILTNYKKRVAKAKLAHLQKADNNSTANEGNNDGQGRVSPAAVTVSSTSTQALAGPETTIPVPRGVTPYTVQKGNIKVITYLDVERVDTAGNRDKRLGLVNVKVAKADGKANNCSNRKSKLAKTNGTRLDSQGRLVKGTANFRACNVGAYKITALGRPGYKVKGSTSVTRNLSNNEQVVVKFVLTKNVKKATKR